MELRNACVVLLKSNVIKKLVVRAWLEGVCKETGGRCGGQVVSLVAVYSNYLSSSPAEVYLQYIICKLLWKNENENNWNKARGWPVF